MTQICDLLGHAWGLMARHDGSYCDPKWFSTGLTFFAWGSSNATRNSEDWSFCVRLPGQTFIVVHVSLKLCHSNCVTEILSLKLCH